MIKLYIEHKIFLLVIFVSIFILSLNEDITRNILITYIISLYVGFSTIRCFIQGNCYIKIWIFLLLFTLTNIIYVAYHDNLVVNFPKLSQYFETQKIIKKNNKIKINNKINKIKIIPNKIYE